VWLDKRNHDREMQLMGHGLGNADNTQNTVFCLFEPGAAGLAADDFPTEDSVFFGSRPGRRRPFLPGMANISTSSARPKWATTPTPRSSRASPGSTRT
jgi:hypothetical protein